jgi:hypothetical protein
VWLSEGRWLYRKALDGIRRPTSLLIEMPLLYSETRT